MGPQECSKWGHNHDLIEKAYRNFVLTLRNIDNEKFTRGQVTLLPYVVLLMFPGVNSFGKLSVSIWIKYLVAWTHLGNNLCRFFELLANQTANGHLSTGRLVSTCIWGQLLLEFPSHYCFLTRFHSQITSWIRVGLPPPQSCWSRNFLYPLTVYQYSPSHWLDPSAERDIICVWSLADTSAYVVNGHLLCAVMRHNLLPSAQFDKRKI